MATMLNTLPAEFDEWDALGNQIGAPTERDAQGMPARYDGIDFQPAKSVSLPKFPTTEWDAQGNPVSATTPLPVKGDAFDRPATETNLRAQTKELANGTRSIVYFPKGTTVLPEPPEQVTIVKGNKPGAGIYYHDDSITPQDIRKAVRRGRLPEFLREANI
jgi:hypothetical protein